MVADVRRLATITDAEVFPAEVDRGIRETMAIRRRDRPRRHRRVGGPGAVGILAAGVADQHPRMLGIAVVLGYAGRAVVVPVVGVSNVRAVGILDFDLETVAVGAGRSVF